MKWLLLLCVSGCLFAGESRADELREQIKICENRIEYAERQAQRLISRDYSSYRFYITMKEKNKRKLQELEQELHRIDPSYSPRE